MVTVAAGKGRLNQLAFHLTKRHADTFDAALVGGIILQPRANAVRRDAAADFNRAGSFDNVLQLTNIAWPYMSLKKLKSFPVHFSRWSPFLERYFTDEMFHQKWNVIMSNAKRWRLQCDTAQMLQQVVSEATFHCQPVQVGMSRRNESDVR